MEVMMVAIAALGRSYGLTTDEVDAAWEKFSRMAAPTSPSEVLASFEEAVKSVRMSQDAPHTVLDVARERSRLADIRADIEKAKR